MRMTLVGALAIAASLGGRPAQLAVQPGERLLVVAPHPDDETLGAGGLIQRVLARGGTVRVVLVTAGDGYIEAVVHETGHLRPRPEEYIAYGERRLRESRVALRVLGGKRIGSEHLLGFPDGGLEPLLQTHWKHSDPERSPTTGAAQAPYPDVEDLGARYDGADLRAALLRCLRDARPTTIVLPDPLDRHPDHHATGLFTLLAVNDWVHEGAAAHRAMPRLLAYLVHWPDWPPGWNVTTPSADAAQARLELPAALHAQGPAGPVLPLTDEEVAGKRAALAEYVTQQREMASLLAAFVRRTEPFRLVTMADLSSRRPSK